MEWHINEASMTQGLQRLVVQCRPLQLKLRVGMGDPMFNDQNMHRALDIS